MISKRSKHQFEKKALFDSINFTGQLKYVFTFGSFILSQGDCQISNPPAMLMTSTVYSYQGGLFYQVRLKGAVKGGHRLGL